MYPLVQLGPFRLSSGGLLLLFSLMLGSSSLRRVARARGGSGLVDQVESCFYPALLGAIAGARLWYGLFNWDLYGRTPNLFWALRVSDLAWPGALLGGSLAVYLWCRLRHLELPAVADSVALALPLPQALASAGLLLSGEAFGQPTRLPWGVPLLGATRHPTQIYFALAALASLVVLKRIDRHCLRKGTLTAAFFGLQGLTLLVIESLRADSLVLPGGLRAAQVFGLALLFLALVWLRGQGLSGQPHVWNADEPAERLSVLPEV